MATKRVLAVMLATALAACGPDVEQFEEQREFNVYQTLDVQLGTAADCDPWKLYLVDTVYLPIGPGSPPCTNPPQPVGDVLAGQVHCDYRPGEDFYYWSDFRYELWDGGTSLVKITTEEPSTSAFLCYLEYSGTVEEL